MPFKQVILVGKQNLSKVGWDQIELRRDINIFTRTLTLLGGPKDKESFPETQLAGLRTARSLILCPKLQL